MYFREVLGGFCNGGCCFFASLQVFHTLFFDITPHPSDSSCQVYSYEHLTILYFQPSSLHLPILYFQPSLLHLPISYFQPNLLHLPILYFQPSSLQSNLKNFHFDFSGIFILPWALWFWADVFNPQKLFILHSFFKLWPICYPDESRTPHSQTCFMFHLIKLFLPTGIWFLTTHFIVTRPLCYHILQWPTE